MPEPEEGKVPDPSAVRQWNARFGLPGKLPNAVAYRAWHEWRAGKIYCKPMIRGTWPFVVTGAKSRFVMHREPSPNKFGRDVKPLFAGAIQPAGKEPDAAGADALPGFFKGLAVPLTGGKISHTVRRKDAGMRRRHANGNACERFNGAAKYRIKSVRGFRSELSALHAPFLSHCNLFRPRSGAGGKGPRRGVGRDGRRAGQAASGHTARRLVLRATRVAAPSVIPDDRGLDLGKTTTWSAQAGSEGPDNPTAHCIRHARYPHLGGQDGSLGKYCDLPPNLQESPSNDGWPRR